MIAGLAVGTMAVGAVVVGTAATAGAAIPVATASTGTSAPSAPSVVSGTGTTGCVRAGRVLARIERVEARIAAGLPGLTKAEAGAKAAGHPARAERIHEAITKLESPRLSAQLKAWAHEIVVRCGTTPASST
jgi:hypothetical protein